MISIVAGLMLASLQKPDLDPRASRLPPHLHPKFYQPGSHLDEKDPLLLLQVANELIPQGEKRCLQYLKSWEDDADHEDFFMAVFWPYLLARVLFIGKNPDYVFPGIIGGGLSKSSDDLKKWPAYPVVIADNSTVLCFPFGAMLGGQIPPFHVFLNDNANKWRVRTTKYILPNDPFLVLPRLLVAGASPEDAKTTQRAVVNQVLKLIRTAYRPEKPGQSHWAEDDPKLFEQLHQEFLKAGCRWDSKISLYVRKDGSFDKDPVEDFPAREYKFPPLKNLKVTLHFDRQERETCGYSADCSETPGKSVSTAVLEAIDPKTKQQLDWIAVNSPSFILPGDTSIQAMLGEAPHAGVPELHRTASSMKLFVMKPVQFVLHYDGKTYTSPELIP